MGGMTQHESKPSLDGFDELLIFICPDGDGVVVSTDGMYLHDLPDLVLENVRPRCLASAAADLVKSVAKYMIATPKAYRPGETVLLHPETIVRFAARPDDDRGHKQWALEDVPAVICAECEGGDHEIFVPPWRGGPAN